MTALATGVAVAQTTPPSSADTGQPASGAVTTSRPTQGPAVATPATVPPIAPNDTGGAVAQKAPSVSEIVVTGTSIRNVAPAGAESITLDPVAIAATSVLSTDQLLATIPELSSFNQLQTGGAGGTELSVNRTNIRNLPQGVGGGSPTLVLMDGHRLVGEGVEQSYPDPDIIPPALIQRVDIVTDGGSAIYGSDAIGGVINFVTKSDFDGFDIGYRHGFGIDYASNDVDVTGGKVWSGGGFYLGYNYSQHDPIYGYDRSYVRNINYATGLPAYTYCNPGNVTANGTNYASNSGNPLQASNANLCDNSKVAAFYPDETRNALLGGFHQQLAPNIEFQVKGYYAKRSDAQDEGPEIGSGQLTPATPGYIPAAGQPAGTAETADFNFAGIPGGEGIIDTKLESWGITPTLTWKFGHDWEMRAYYNYGDSKTTVNDPQVNQSLLTSDINSGLVNPYNIGSSNASALGQVLDYTQFGIGEDRLSNAKVTFDGPLFHLPGGDVRMAIGGEYIHEHYQGTTDEDTFANVALAPLEVASRNVASGFAELNIPIIGPSNNIPFIYSFNLAAAARHDQYSDFGGNWAPNLGATIKPVSWLGVRVRWNKSFQAPSLVQLAQAAVPTASVFPNIYTEFVSQLVDPFYANNGGSIVAVQGTVTPLQPERARDYNVGMDVSPPIDILKGLNFHFTYWNIDYSGQISAPPLGSGIFFGVPTFDALLLTNPSAAQLSAFLAKADVPASQITNVIAEVNALGGTTYYAADIRARNLGISETDGFDISLDYHHAVPFGTVFLNFNSSFTNTAINAADGVTFTANQAGVNGTRFNTATVIGTTVGDHFRGQLTWNRLSGFELSTPAAYGQTYVEAFNTLDAYLQYDLKRPGFLPITFSLGIINMFNTNPPPYYGDSPAFGAGYANGSTTGRVFQLGANVKF